MFYVNEIKRNPDFIFLNKTNSCKKKSRSRFYVHILYHISLAICLSSIMRRNLHVLKMIIGNRHTTIISYIKLCVVPPGDVVVRYDVGR